MPVRGDIRSVQVPGAVDGWLSLHERYGRLPLHEVLAPAIELAEEGFPASLMLALASHLVHALPGAGELCPDGPLAVGQTVRLPGIARTLRAIARDGRDGFYLGEFGRGLQELGGGHFAPADLATSAAVWSTPLRATAWGHDLWTVPPPSQGYLTLAGAVVAQEAGLGTRPRRSPVGPSPGRDVACRRPRPPGDALRRRRRRRAPPPRASRRRRGPRRPPRRMAPPDVAPGGGAAMAPRACPAWATGTPRTCARRTPTALASRSRNRTRWTSARTSSSPQRASSCTTGASASRSSRATRPRWHRDAGPRTPSPPCSSPTPRRGAVPPGRGHGRRRPAADHRAAPGPAAPGRPRSGDAPSRRPGYPRRALGRALPPVVGRGPHRAGGGGRAPHGAPG